MICIIVDEKIIIDNGWGRFVSIVTATHPKSESELEENTPIYQGHFRYRELTPQERKTQARLEVKVASICRLYKNGKTLNQIAGIHKVSRESVRQILKNHGISTNRKPKYVAGDTKKTAGGYILVYIGKDAMGANKDGWILEHRKVMQESLRRLLKAWEIVHHRNRIKDDNRLENLELTTRANHPTCLKCPYYEFYVKTTGYGEIQ